MPAPSVHLVSDLQARGLVAQASDPQIDAKLAALASHGPISAYAGFDPTADSLHIGHFMGILGLIYAQRNGIRPIAVIGGATGLIGDPSGKTTERQLLTKEAVADNVRGIRAVLEKFLDFHHPTAPATIVNNLDWFGPMSAIDFLRDVGRHFRLGSMLSKESVKARMEAAGAEGGMSYTEFSYQLLQGYDFYRLYKDHRCVLQLGGTDQWGNITAGIDAIRKIEGESGNVFALTWPLMTTSSGQKFGKSEGNAVWLSAAKTSPYDFYQFWLRTEDADAERYLKFFTFLPAEEIGQIVEAWKREPEKRGAQKKLAEVMTRAVHGEEGLRQATAGSEIFTLKIDPATIDAATLERLAQQIPTVEVGRDKLSTGWLPPDALVDAGLSKSKGEARRLITQGGFYVNDQPWTDPTKPIREADLLAGTAVVLRSGKKNYRLARVR